MLHVLEHTVSRLTEVLWHVGLFWTRRRSKRSLIYPNGHLPPQLIQWSLNLHLLSVSSCRHCWSLDISLEWTFWRSFSLNVSTCRKLISQNHYMYMYILTMHIMWATHTCTYTPVINCTTTTCMHTPPVLQPYNYFLLRVGVSLIRWMYMYMHMNFKIRLPLWIYHHCGGQRLIVCARWQHLIFRGRAAQTLGKGKQKCPTAIGETRTSDSASRARVFNQQPTGVIMYMYNWPIREEYVVRYMYTCMWVHVLCT